jgi:hypothetical protein
MESNSQSPEASLGAKFGTFASSLTPDEAALFVSFIENAGGAEVAGFDQAQTQPALPQPQVDRMFSMISNIMKTKHDTVKNSISNIR